MSYPKEILEWLKDYVPFDTVPIQKFANKITTQNPAARAKEVVIKMLELGKKGSKGYDIIKAQAVKEVEKMRQFSSATCIINVFDYKEHVNPDNMNCFFYIIMEYGGPDLEIYLAKAKRDHIVISFKDKVDILIQIASALSELQKKLTMHCDVKLENVVIKDGKIKLVDFRTTVTVSSVTTYEKETEYGLIGFTPVYAPPEVLTKSPLHISAIDVYCFGKMMYQVMCELSPDQMEKDLMLYTKFKQTHSVFHYECNEKNHDKIYLEKIRNAEIPNDPGFRIQISNIIVNCMNWNPTDRWNFEIVISELKKLLLIPDPIVPPHLPSNATYLNPTNRTLYKIKNEIGKYDSFDDKFINTIESQEISDIPKDYAKFSTISTPDNKIVFLIGGAAGSSEPSSDIY